MSLVQARPGFSGARCHHHALPPETGGVVVSWVSVLNSASTRPIAHWNRPVTVDGSWVTVAASWSRAVRSSR